MVDVPGGPDFGQKSPYILIFTLAPSSSCLYSAQNPQLIPIEPWHFPGAGLILLLPLPKSPLWLSPAQRAPKDFSERCVKIKLWDPSGSGR